MAAKKGAKTLSEAEFIEELANRVQLPKGTVATVIKGFKAEASECLTLGYKVSLTGFVTITPSAKEGRKKGTVVNNPFDGTSKTLRADEPDKFVVKARVSPSVVKQFPGVKSAAGQALVKQLKPAKKK